MERTEKIGLAVAIVGHAALFALLAIGFLSEPRTEEIRPKAIDISLVDKVALESTAPPAVDPPTQSRAPEPAPPAEAAPPEAAREPKPELRPVPVKPSEPVPAPAPKPAPKAPPPPKKPPVTKPETPDKPKISRIKSAVAPAKQVSTAKGTGTNAAAKKPRAGGFVLDPETLTGKTVTPTRAKVPSPAAPGATMDAAAAADIGSAIKRQVQPCADRQVNPGPGASRIIVTIRLKLNRDGTLDGRPTVADAHGGVDDQNSRYVDAVDRNAIASFMGCAPLRGLPPELYDVPRGWKTFSLRYKLPD
jgi:outer membrane biosynthesis protein TonB